MNLDLLGMRPFAMTDKEISELPSTPKVKVIVDPKSGDIHRAEDVLVEVQAVLRKYGYGIAHRPNAMILVKMNGAMAQATARVIAEVRQITPHIIDYRDIDWTPKVNNGGG